MLSAGRERDMIGCGYVLLFHIGTRHGVSSKNKNTEDSVYIAIFGIFVCLAIFKFEVDSIE